MEDFTLYKRIVELEDKIKELLKRVEKLEQALCDDDGK